jgi:hypothetical protein
MSSYVNFSLKSLSCSISTFSSSPQISTESSLDRDAFMKSIFDQATHKISGKQNEYGAALRRMHDLMNAASAQEHSGTPPQSRPQPASQQTAPQESAHASGAEQPEPARAEHDHHEHTRRQAEQRHASHLHRTHAQAGRSNALSLLGGHSVPGGQDHFGNHGVPAGERDAAILEEIRQLRDALDASSARPSSRTQTDNG